MAVSRNITIGIDPKDGLTNTYTWAIVEDGNSAGKVLVCGYIPRTKGSGISPMQETMFLGGLNLGTTYQTLQQNLAQDDGVDFEADAIFSNLDPVIATEGTADTKRFVRLDFPTFNPFSKNVTVRYSSNTESPQERPATWYNFTHTAGSLRAFFNGVTARFVNVRVTKTTAIPATEPILSSFIVFFYRLFGRKGDQS